MSNFILLCDCGSFDFIYSDLEQGSYCEQCGSFIHDKDAGRNMIKLTPDILITLYDKMCKEHQPMYLSLADKAQRQGLTVAEYIGERTSDEVNTFSIKIKSSAQMSPEYIIKCLYRMLGHWEKEIHRKYRPDENTEVCEVSLCFMDRGISIRRWLNIAKREYNKSNEILSEHISDMDIVRSQFIEANQHINERTNNNLIKE